MAAENRFVNRELAAPARRRNSRDSARGESPCRAAIINFSCMRRFRGVLALH